MYVINDYKRTFLGNFMYNFTTKISKFLMNHLWLYYILSYTWALLNTIVGWIVYLIVLIFSRNKLKVKVGPVYGLRTGKDWGGISVGKCFFYGTSNIIYEEHTCYHEMGHTFQSAILGPFMLFVVFLPSVIRCALYNKGKIKKEYDAIWFEGGATDIGYLYRERI